MLKIDLFELIRKAEQSSRQRHTFSLKEGSYPGCRYMINAIMPSTYLQPHSHSLTGANELWFVLKGVITPVLFSEDGEITNVYDIAYTDDIPFIETPENTFHTLLIRNSPSVILEVSKGPYDPETFKEFAPWAPSESDLEESRKYLAELERKIF